VVGCSLFELNETRVEMKATETEKLLSNRRSPLHVQSSMVGKIVYWKTRTV